MATKNRELTRKQAAFVREVLDNPKQSATESAARTYNTKNRHTAEVIAYENLRKPEIVSKLAEYTTLAESAIIGTVQDWKGEENSRKREIAMQNAQYIHDKVHGRATQQIETTSKQISISIDLTSPEPTG